MNWEQVVERSAERTRTDPAAPGLGGGQNTVEMSPDHWRTSAGQKVKAHRGSGHCARFGVRPMTGKVADIHESSLRADDPMLNPEPIPSVGRNTPRQNRLRVAAAAFMHGDLAEGPRKRIRDQIAAEVEALAGIGTATDDADTLAFAQGIGKITGIRS